MAYYPLIINRNTNLNEIIKKWENRNMLFKYKNKINVSLAFEMLSFHIISNGFDVKPLSLVVPSLFPIVKRLINAEGEQEMKWMDINETVINVLEEYPKLYLKFIKKNKRSRVTLSQKDLVYKELSLIDKFCLDYKSNSLKNNY